MAINAISIIPAIFLGIIIFIIEALLIREDTGKFTKRIKSFIISFVFLIIMVLLAFNASYLTNLIALELPFKEYLFRIIIGLIVFIKVLISNSKYLAANKIKVALKDKVFKILVISLLVMFSDKLWLFVEPLCRNYFREIC